ncbi:MAG: hypothetical protein H0V22_11925 [Solirubrobacterales bacterium]|nr:hypothetical protein [Solirubrobacterales bacterium]
MKGLLRRIRPARDEEHAATSVTAAASPVPTGSLPAGEPAEDTAAADPRPPLPAGVAPEELIGDPPDTRRRGRLRRRLRHLRQVRELMLRDVGGLVYEFHRAGARSGPGEPGDVLVGRKLDRLAGLDLERRELEELLEDRRAETVLREPGVGGTCAVCGDYFASDAHFCAHCGERVDGRASDGSPVETGHSRAPAESHPDVEAEVGSGERAAHAGRIAT